MSTGEQIAIGLIVVVTLPIVIVCLCVIKSSNSGPSASKFGGPFTRRKK